MNGGDCWRWNVMRHGYARQSTISVIEAPDDEERPRGHRKVPFGFGRVLLHDEPPPVTARRFPG